MTTPISVSLVEDDDRVRDSLGVMIDCAPGFRCLSSYPSSETALAGLPNDGPHVVLMDIHLPRMNGVECVRRLKVLAPKIQVMMLTVYEDTEIIFKALSAGATGYLLKQTPIPELLSAIREIHGGGSPMTNHIARKVVQSFQSPSTSTIETENLSPREQEVLDYLSRGYLYKEIAETLHISFDTVHTYVRRIYEKLHVRSRTEAVAIYLRH